MEGCSRTRAHSRQPCLESNWALYARENNSTTSTPSQHEGRTEATEQRAGPVPSTPQAQSPSQKTAGAPKVYTGDTATGGRTPRRRYISISSVARLPPSE